MSLINLNQKSSLSFPMQIFLHQESYIDIFYLDDTLTHKKDIYCTGYLSRVLAQS